MSLFNKNTQSEPTPKERTVRTITKVEALILIVAVVGIMVLNAVYWGLGTSMGLLLCGIALTLYGILFTGRSWESFWEATMVSGKKIFPILYVCLLCGVVQAGWIMSGTVPMFMYYGLDLLSPSSYLVVSFVVTFVIGVLTGNGWGTMLTVGLALVNVGNALGVPVIYSVAAIVGGAMQGDRWSPLVDTFNLCCGTAGSDPIKTWKSMALPTLIAFAISTVLYFLIGQGLEVNTSANLGDVDHILATLDANFDFNIFMLIPLAIFVVLLIFKVDSAPSYFISAFSGVVVGVIWNGVDFMAGMSALWNGWVSEIGDPLIDEMLTKGGFVANSSLLMLLFMAFYLAGSINNLNVLNVLLEGLVDKIKNSGVLVLAATCTSFLTVMMCSSAYASILLNGEIYKDIFQKFKLAPEALAGVLADGCAITGSCLPWNATGMVVAATLLNGDWTFGWIPFCFIMYLAPLANIVLSYLNINVPKLEAAEQTKAV